MALLDCRDVPVSTSKPSSLAQLEIATELLHGYYGDPLALIDQTLVEDPQFMMGHVFRADLLITAADKAVEPLLRHSVEAGEALLRSANERERRHLAAARSWLDGDFAHAVQRYGEIVIDYPRDSLALQLAHIGDFLLGQSTLLRDRVAQVLPHWDDSVPGYGFVLGMHAFGLEETNLYRQAEARGNQALLHNRRDPWAIHAVAHVMEMEGRQADGIEWLKSRAGDWSVDNMFAVHHWWHLGLFQLDLGQHPEVLKLYDSRIRQTRSAMALDLVDACAMLWRLQLRAVDVGDRWHELASIFDEKADAGYYAFNDVHAMMAFVGDRREAAAERLLRSMRQAAAGRGSNAVMTREVGLPVAEALLAFGHADYGDAIDRLLAVRHLAQRFGGSHAQRDLLHLTVLEAACRAGRKKLAEALAAERVALKPGSPFNRNALRRAQTLH